MTIILDYTLLKSNDFVRGKSLWQFNNSILNEIEYVSRVNKIINGTRLENAVPVYDIDNINKIPHGDLQFTIDDQLLLETLLMNIRGKGYRMLLYIKTK